MRYDLSDNAPETLNLQIIRTGNFRLIEIYKKHLIYDSAPEESKEPCLQVYSPERDTLFIVGLDDSKRTGKRVFTPAEVEDARNYIDWISTKYNAANTRPIHRKFNARNRRG